MSFLPSRAICVLAPSFVFALLLCGGCGTGQPDEPPLPGGIDLPEVGTLGRAPRGDATIVVNVTGDGEITVGGKGPLSLVGLRDELTRLTKPARWREADRTSRKILLVNADASLPWPVSVWLMQVAAEPGIELYRVFFGARTADRVGAVGWTLPTSTRGIVDGPAPATLYLAIRAHDGKKATPETLLPALSVLAAQAGDEPLMLDIRVPPPGQGAIRTGFVIQVVDMALRAGVSRLRFQGMPPPVPKETREDVDAFLRHVQRLKEEAGVPSLWVAGTTLKGPLPSTPTPPSRGRLSYLYGAEVAKTEPRPEKPDEPPAPEEDVEFLADKEIEPYRLDEPGPTVEFTRPSPWYARDDRSAFPGRRRRSEDAKEEAVEAALRWLAAHQSPNGGWEAAGFPAWCRGLPNPSERLPEGRGDASHDVGVSGLALCAFLGAGYTNRGKHPYAKTISKGLRYLKRVQDAEGCFGSRTNPRFVYDHAIAALAMVEAYGMTGSPIFKGSAQRGLDFIALSRNPYFAWRYGVKPGENDTSVTAWMCSALLAARWVNENALAHDKRAPLTVDEEAFLGVRAWLDAATDERSGRIGYQEKGSRSDRPADLVDRFPPEKTEAMTAAGLWLRLALDSISTDDVGMVWKWKYRASKSPPTWSVAEGTIDFIYWYFGSLASYQLGGGAGTRWSEALREELLAHQRGGDDPCAYAGSWDPAGPWGRIGGRVAATALLAMCLETPYRYPRR